MTPQPGSSPSPVCGFCAGRPVGNAATWQDGRPRPPIACPRCGQHPGSTGADNPRAA